MYLIFGLLTTVVNIVEVIFYLARILHIDAVVGYSNNINIVNSVCIYNKPEIFIEFGSKTNTAKELLKEIISLSLDAEHLQEF